MVGYVSRFKLLFSQCVLRQESVSRRSSVSWQGRRDLHLDLRDNLTTTNQRTSPMTKTVLNEKSQVFPAHYHELREVSTLTQTSKAMTPSSYSLPPILPLREALETSSCTSSPSEARVTWYGFACSWSGVRCLYSRRFLVVGAAERRTYASNGTLTSSCTKLTG